VAGEDHTARPGDQTETERRRYTVAEAAEILGITAEAVRTRIKRGKLESVKEGGTVHVLLRVDQTGPNIDPTVKGQDRTADQTRPDELIAALREQVAYLRGVIATRDQRLATRAEEIRRRDAALEREQRLTAFFAERLRELEAPAEVAEASEEAPRSEAQDAPESAQPRPGTLAPPDAGGGAQEASETPEGGPRRGSWSRLFGGG
jgi:excisionase family DNA binding protein